MHRGGHDVELGEKLVRIVERPIRADVDLGADDDAERRELRIQARRVGEPCRDPFREESAEIKRVSLIFDRS